jgi:hypothetical protein
MGSLREAVESVLDSVGQYNADLTDDSSLPCGQGPPTSPTVSSSYAGPHNLSGYSEVTPTNSPPRTPPRLRSISTQTGQTVEGDFFYLNRWLDRCRVSAAIYFKYISDPTSFTTVRFVPLYPAYFILTGDIIHTYVYMYICIFSVPLAVSRLLLFYEYIMLNNTISGLPVRFLALFYFNRSSGIYISFDVDVV